MNRLKPASQKNPYILDLVLTSAAWTTSEILMKQHPEAQLDKKIAYWKSDRSILSVTQKGVEYFLVDSFENGELSAWMPQLMRVFNQKSDLAIAAWLMSSNSWLRDTKPIAKIREEFDSVLYAATQECAGIQHG